ncbi:condensation domain-containing protein [Pelistega ratti]|nr:condensation domain-containing protein [Pelistega ratti]
MSYLTPLQIASWFGRINHNTEQCSVSAHLYIEFDHSTLDIVQLKKALIRLYDLHEILRLSLTKIGEPCILNKKNIFLSIDDISTFTLEEKQEFLWHKRQEWSNQQLNLEDGQTAKFSLTKIDENYFRLHIDTDMIAIDPSSCRILLEDLAYLYNNTHIDPSSRPSFIQWRQFLLRDSHIQQLRKRDELWWKDRLSFIAPAPSIPFSNNKNTIKTHRLSHSISRENLLALRDIAKTMRISLSNFVLGLFAFNIFSFTKNRIFRLNIPFFWREPIVENIQNSIGDFANFSILNVDLSQEISLSVFLNLIEEQMVELIEHRHYDGVNIMRDLSRLNGRVETSPIVFTSAINLEERNLFSKNIQTVLGTPVWMISQGPGVALDAQVAIFNDELFINWDIRLDMLPFFWIYDCFNSFIDLLKRVIKSPSLLQNKIDEINSPLLNHPVKETPLNSLQKAYILGRDTTLPLGGVAMQEFREYEGTISSSGKLKKRLFSMVKSHPCLRTYINPQNNTQFVNDELHLNLKEYNLISLKKEIALELIQSYKKEYSHDLFSFKYSPWDLSFFYLSDNTLIIFARFDALIVDGRSIAQLMFELFSDVEVNIAKNIKKIQVENNQERQLDRNYWLDKLKDITKPLVLPHQPLKQVTKTIFNRKTILIPKEIFKSISIIGAKQGLSNNSLIMSIILDILTHWLQQDIYVAVPVLPLYSDELSNKSSFIIIKWSNSTETFLNKAITLQEDILEGLQHLRFSGVDLTRYLLVKIQCSPVLPIVITNGLSWATLPIDSGFELTDGLTQTPQIGLDLRFTYSSQKDLLFHIDFVNNFVSEEQIEYILLNFKSISEQIYRHQSLDFTISNYKEEDISKNLLSIESITLLLRDVMDISPSVEINAFTEIVQLGLSIQDLKLLCQEINKQYDIAVSPKQLLSCKTVNDFIVLISTYLV